MKLAFVLFRYFPYGGLQRDMLEIARQCRNKGHDITVITREWNGNVEAGINVEIINVGGITNHRKDLNFSRQITPALRERFDLVIGFNKMPNLDIYYAADSCFADKVYRERPWWYRYTPRAKIYLSLEHGVFQKNKNTHALMISKNEMAVYESYYQTEKNRLHYLPPGIKRDRIRPENADNVSRRKRHELGIADDEFMVLFIGSGFRTKGLDRAIIALANLPSHKLAKTKLWVVGQDKEREFKKLAQKHGVEDKIHFMGGRDDVAEWLWTADVLIHPAYRENTGTVLLEAMIAGCPVLTTAACGYSFYVKDAEMGKVIELPFKQENLNIALNEMLEKNQSCIWHQRGFQFANLADIYSLTERAAELIERIGMAK